MITNLNKRSEILISKHEFENIEDALKYLINKNGQPTEIQQGINLIKPDSDKPYEIKYYQSEINNVRFDYTIKQFKNRVELEIFKTNLHPMITAAEKGNLNLFIDSLDDSQKMIDFSADKAIQNNNLDILKYLISNKYEVSNPIYRAISYDNTEALDFLLNSGFSLHGDWLQHCIRNNSRKIIDEYLFKRKTEFNPSSPDYFRKLMNEESFLIKEVREFLNKEGIKI